VPESSVFELFKGLGFKPDSGSFADFLIVKNSAQVTNNVSKIRQNEK
jgi:hypothetical protein